MTLKVLQGLGIPSDLLYTASLGSIVLCLFLWIRAKTVDQEARANAERRAMFVGFWPPMFWLIGDKIAELERRPSSRRR